MPKKQTDKIQAEYDFLQARAHDDGPFLLEELGHAGGRKLNASSLQTFKSKKWGQFLHEVDAQSFRFNKEFRDVTLDEYRALFSQAARHYSDYDRFVHRNVLVFEFFLPLTHERKLRESLDRLFYADKVKQRLEEIGLARLGAKVVRRTGEGSEAYYARLIARVSDAFGGYSIRHVTGRFRAPEIMTQQAASQHVLNGKHYLIDETTAVVTFIVPCGAAVRKEMDDLDDSESPHTGDV